MDYPKSVPGVGLVGGKFVDENTATGQQGSLIPSAWGNAVTDEISNVIKDAGDVPAEGDLSQLQKAIRKIVALVWPKATDVEVSAGVVDDKVVTPKKLRAGFSSSLRSIGFIALPSWLGGVIFQWGVNFGSVSGAARYSYPIAFPNRCASMAATVAGATAANSARCQIVSSSQFDIASTNYNGTSFAADGIYWIAVGY